MQCVRPLRANFAHDLNTITFSTKNASRETAGFQLPCRKCLPCRLNTAREKAIRCYHESQMHPENIFATFTYDDLNLKSPKLVYEDWQLFLKRLRIDLPQKIPTMVTGEYGEKTKRPHFHALIFNYRPADQKYKYTSDRGDTCYSSESLTKLWKKGLCEYGEITIDSANYVARYAAKKLVHGKDQDHDYHPLHKTSSKYGIGRSWIEKYHEHALQNGFVLLPNNAKTKIPRYYIDWAKKNKPDLWLHYVTEIQPKISKEMEALAVTELQEWLDHQAYNYETFGSGAFKILPEKRNIIKERILQLKFKKLQETLKL